MIKPLCSFLLYQGSITVTNGYYIFFCTVYVEIVPIRACACVGNVFFLNAVLPKDFSKHILSTVAHSRSLDSGHYMCI